MTPTTRFAIGWFCICLVIAAAAQAVVMLIGGPLIFEGVEYVCGGVLAAYVILHGDFIRWVTS